MLRSTSSNFLFNIKHHIRWVVLCVLFLVAAHSFSSIHASIHEFHEHSEVCELLEELGQSSTTTYEYSVGLFNTFSDWFVHTLYTDAVINPLHRFFSQAPPLISNARF